MIKFHDFACAHVICCQTAVSTQSKNPMDPMGSHELLPMGRLFPMWSVPFHMGTDVPWGYLMWKWPFPMGSYVNAYYPIPMWLTWDRIYLMGNVFISHGILFSCERQSSEKDLLSCVRYFITTLYMGDTLRYHGGNIIQACHYPLSIGGDNVLRFLLPPVYGG